MPNTRQANAVRLEFQPGGLVHTNLSGAAFSREWLWVAGDEACGVERLSRLPPVDDEALRFGDSHCFPLGGLLDLPGGPDEEADLEGLALADGWLWLVGSHGLKRKNAKSGREDDDNARRLTRLKLDGNRRLLARVPVEERDGVPHLVRHAEADGRRAARLHGDAEDNELTRLLRDDEHLGPFLHIPGKDNGFDIEGLALLDERRLLLGLRGPVLRGWSLLLEIAVEPHHGELRLAPLDRHGTRLRKHFLQLGGMGVRDLHFDGDDLYVLAGPTMVLDGDIRLLRWPNARRVLADNRQAVRFERELAEILELPHAPGSDRAEAFCEVPAALVDGAQAWLVLYDAPGPQRRGEGCTVFGDLLRRD